LPFKEGKTYIQQIKRNNPLRWDINHFYIAFCRSAGGKSNFFVLFGAPVSASEAWQSFFLRHFHTEQNQSNLSTTPATSQTDFIRASTLFKLHLSTKITINYKIK
jgi:hypothetical protein